MDELIKFPTSVLAKAKGFNVFNDNELGYASNEFVFDPDGTLCRLSYECNPLVDNKSWFELRKYNSSDKNDPKNYRKFPIKNHFEAEGIETYLVPTQTALHKWLREVHHIDVDIESDRALNTEIGCYSCLILSPTDTKFHWNVGGFHKTYELAMEAGLEEALKLIPVSLGEKCSFMIDTKYYSGIITEINYGFVSAKVYNGIIDNIPYSTLNDNR